MNTLLLSRNKDCQGSTIVLNRLSRIQEHLGNTNMDHLGNIIIDHLDTPVIFTLHINYDLAGPSHRDQMSKIG